MSGLARNNPFKRRSCGRPKCPLFLAGNRCNEQCYKEGILYAASCNRCHQSQLDAGLDPKERMYIGESSRTLYTRAQQHLNDYRVASAKGPGHTPGPSEEAPSSWMWEHSLEEHGGSQNLETDYNFQVLCSYRDPLTRQVAEATRIQKALRTQTHIQPDGKPVNIISLNRKGEYFAPLERWNEEN